ncbi:MAG: tetratricopeptide repeat protein, partial [Kangiellaceae bacterium]|nr:tetratricopeptide repeat protein [Kangiellaceae bacterium]
MITKLKAVTNYIFQAPFKKGWPLLLLFSISGVNAQISYRDSLQIEISKFQNSSKENNDYVDLLLDLGFEQRYYNLDSLKILSELGLKLSEKLGHEIGKANAYLGLGIYYSDKGKYDESLSNLQKALDISFIEKDDTLRLT